MDIDRLNLQTLEGVLNSDAEFVLQARYLSTRVRVIIGDVQSFCLIVTDGRVEIDPTVTQFDQFDINMEGSAEAWLHLLSPVPPAFYQDFFPAMLHHGFRLEGDMATIIAYYPAIRRLCDLFRQVSNEEVAA